jgi:hypothetical protein
LLWHLVFGSRSAPPAGLEPATCGLEVRCSIQLSYRGLRRSLCALVHATGAAWTFGVELSRVGEQARGADVTAKPDLHATVIGSYMVSVVDSVGKSFASGQLERDGLR